MGARKGRWELDLTRFMFDFEVACVGLGVCSAQAARELGIPSSSLTRMKTLGVMPGAREVVAVAAYAGLNLNEYLVDLDHPSCPVNPRERSWTFRSALERIKQLEEELKRASQQA